MFIKSLGFIEEIINVYLNFEYIFVSFLLFLNLIFEVMFKMFDKSIDIFIVNFS